MTEAVESPVFPTTRRLSPTRRDALRPASRLAAVLAALMLAIPLSATPTVEDKLDQLTEKIDKLGERIEGVHEVVIDNRIALAGLKEANDWMKIIGGSSVAVGAWVLVLLFRMNGRLERLRGSLGDRGD